MIADRQGAGLWNHELHDARPQRLFSLSVTNLIMAMSAVYFMEDSLAILPDAPDERCCLLTGVVLRHILCSAVEKRRRAARRGDIWRGAAASRRATRSP